ncbi:MAG: formyl transferase, partial [Mesorhizobium sp.]
MATSESGPRRIVVVTEGGPHIWAIVNAIADRVGPVSVILETP